MIKLEFTEAEKRTLNYERHHHPHPRVQCKLEAVWLKSQRVAHGEISRLTGISGTTLTSYLRAYQQGGGIEALKMVRFDRPQSELRVPITLVLDNARYQKCRVVEALAGPLQIEMLYLPAYSPNLNLIERLWKFVKKTCLYSTYYANFQDFTRAISTCLAQPHTTYKKELDSLLTLRFQSFKESQVIAV